jgi:hypothetical protein
MAMNENNKYKNQGGLPGADELDKWIRLAVDLSGEEPVERPPEEDIESYLHGTASDVQQKRVQDALVKSQDFRKELIDRAGVLQTEETVRREERVSWFQRLSELFRMPRVAVPAAAVLVVLVAAVVVIRGPMFNAGYSVSTLTEAEAAGWSGAMVNLRVVPNLRDGDPTDVVPTQIPADGTVLLHLPVMMIPGQAPPATVEVEKEIGELVWSAPLSPAEISGGRIRVVIEVSSFEPGNYWMKVLDAERRQIARSLFQIGGD